jgi:two-component system nitrogen regulation sensor histidine kinase NtrY
VKSVPLINLTHKISLWRRKRRVQMALAWVLILLGPILIGLTVYITQGGLGGRSTGVVRGILLIDVVYLLVIISLIGFSVMRILAARRAQSAGSRLHLRLSAVFAIVALIPTVLVAVFAVLTLSIGVEGWFSENVRNVVGSSLSAAEAYKEEQRNDLEADLNFMAFNLSQLSRDGSFISDADLRVQLTRVQNFVQRGVKEAYVLDGSSKLRARGELSYLFGFEEPTTVEMNLALVGKAVVIEDWENNEFRALVRLNGFPDRFLYISRTVDGAILKLLDETAATAKTYNQMETQRDQILSYYGLLYLGFASFVILSATWLGMLFAERLSRPVGRLAGAAQRVGAGDFDVQVAEEKGDDEIAMLGRVFNRMTQQVKRQRDDLITANEVTDRRRRLFDSVLSGVSAGVVGLSHDGKIAFVNAAAERLLNLDAQEDEGKDISLAVPEFLPLFETTKDANTEISQREISLTRAGNAEVLLVRMAARRGENDKIEGYVVSFDDVTDLVSAQRMAAWGDVARRIAHEIKNPLTPIQLSAERLKRKFGPMVGAEQDNLAQYSDVIIRQTNDLRRIVDEFSKFARMPEPETRDVDLTKLLSDTVLLFKTANENIKVKLNNDLGKVTAQLDETMMNQALTNLIKNAAEATETFAKGDAPKNYQAEIRVSLIAHNDGAEICIQDNGIGLPEHDRSRLFEPYVTHRESGTGLGLSIVKKIIEEHGGSLELLDAPPFGRSKHFGAMARVRLPFVKIKELKKSTTKVA